MTGRWPLVVGSVAMALGVALGAYGAHGLATWAPAERVATWNTAVLYHLIHGLALIVAGMWVSRGRAFVLAAVAFCIGLLLFSGSLYALVLSGLTGLGAVTPFGGVAFLTGWGALAIGFGRERFPGSENDCS